VSDARHIVSVFGSSIPSKGAAEYQTAYELGKLLAQSQYVVCNGGYGGTMEASARGAREAQGKTIGVVCRVFGASPNPFIDETFLTDTLNERLLKLMEMGSAYVVLRGGTGTLLELAAVWEFMNKRMLDVRPIIVLGAFWSPLVASLSVELRAEGRTAAAGYVREAGTPAECVEMLRKLLPPTKRA